MSNKQTKFKFRSFYKNMQKKTPRPFDYSAVITELVDWGITAVWLLLRPFVDVDGDIITTVDDFSMSPMISLVAFESVVAGLVVSDSETSFVGDLLLGFVFVGEEAFVFCTISANVSFLFQQLFSEFMSSSSFGHDEGVETVEEKLEQWSAAPPCSNCWWWWWLWWWWCWWWWWWSEAFDDDSSNDAAAASCSARFLRLRRLGLLRGDGGVVCSLLLFVVRFDWISGEAFFVVLALYCEFVVVVVVFAA
jgi:hypothetical protein